MLHAGGASAFLYCGRGRARLPLNGVPAAKLRAGHARPLRQSLPCQREVPNAVRRRDSWPFADVTGNPARPVGIPPSACGVHLPLTREAQTVEKGAFPPWPPLRGGSARRRWGRELCGCPPFYIAARGLAWLPLYGVPAARLRAGHARPLRSARGVAFSFWHIFSSFLRFWNIFRLFCTNRLLFRFLLYYND